MGLISLVQEKVISRKLALVIAYLYLAFTFSTDPLIIAVCGFVVAVYIASQAHVDARK